MIRNSIKMSTKAGISANFGIVMAKLVIEGKDHGVWAFVVQLRSLDDHRLLRGIESGDIGCKSGFESTDNGFVKFSHHRVPRINMLMRYGHVHEDGRFEKKGNEIVMYASMLVLRTKLCIWADMMLSVSTTIAIRYSAVRHQTANLEGYIYVIGLNFFFLFFKQIQKIESK